MAGHLDEAAAVLNTAAQTVPQAEIGAASQALDAVVGHIAAVGGGFGADMTAEAQALRTDLETVAGRLAGLSAQLSAAATAIMSGGS